jgi:hypothetical protein
MAVLEGDRRVLAEHGLAGGREVVEELDGEVRVGLRGDDLDPWRLGRVAEPLQVLRVDDRPTQVDASSRELEEQLDRVLLLEPAVRGRVLRGRGQPRVDGVDLLAQVHGRDRYRDRSLDRGDARLPVLGVVVDDGEVERPPGRQALERRPDDRLGRDPDGDLATDAGRVDRARQQGCLEDPVPVRHDDPAADRP